MPEMQPSEPAATGLSPVAFTAAATDDFDYALGFECADPALQIERWSLEAAPSAGELS